MERLVLEFVCRAALIAASAAAVIFALRLRSAAAQHALWAGVLVTMLALPPWLAWGPKAPIPVLRAAPLHGAAAPAVRPIFGAALGVSSSAPRPAAPPVWNWGAAVAGAYALIAGLLLLRLAAGTIRARRLTAAHCAAPITVGLLRPRIILPASAAAWPPVQLDAVLAHERAHVRRRDPLVQWLALLNRALFWFHPLAWWLERRLSALAEEACDAAVLAEGYRPADYSLYLLDLARAVERAGGRLNVAGVAMPGSDLPRRIRRIAAGLPAPRVSPVRITAAALLAGCGAAIFAAVSLDAPPQTIQILADRPKFEVAAIRPCKPSDITQGPGKKGGRGGGGRFRTTPDSVVAECQTVENLVRQAFLFYSDGKPWPADKATGVPVRPLPNSVLRQEIKGPGWIASDRYTVEAKAGGEMPGEMLRGPMMQRLLEDRFHLKVRIETREVPVFVLTVAPGGPKLQPAKEGSCISIVEFEEKYPGPQKPGQPVPHVCGPFRPSILDRNPNIGRAEASRTIGLDTWGQDMAMLCLQFSVSTDREVIDRTGLTGQYDLHLDLASLDLFPEPPSDADTAEPPPTPEQKIAHIAAAVRKLGLDLQPSKAPMPFLVIDHVERPSAN